ncbi:MAG: hypothetical protein HY335_07410 [Deinococcus sp.]|nr:hypothetical protein [Deinococcus sp.]
MKTCLFLRGFAGGGPECCAVLGGMLPSIFELRTYCTTPAFSQCPLFQLRLSCARPVAVSEYLQLTGAPQAADHVTEAETPL